MASNSDLQWIGQTVGAKLRAARLARKLTQSQLAQPDFSVSYVSAIERGQIHPSLRALEIFAQRLGLTSSDLLSNQTGQVLYGLPEKDDANENKQDTEFQLLEAQLLIIQGNCREAVTLLRNISSDALKPQQKIRQCYLLGRAFYRLGLLQECESILSEASKLTKDLNDFFTGRILDALGMVHVSMRNHTQGFEYQLRNLDQLEKVQQRDAFFDAQVYTNIGLHYMDLDKIDDAIEMFQHALAMTKRILAPDRLIAMYWDIFRYLAETQNYFLATLYGHKTLQLLIRDYCDSMKSEMYHYLGQAMLNGDQQKTVIYLERLLLDGSLEKDTLAFASVTASTADALFRQGEMRKAYEYAQKACELALAYRDSIVTASIFLSFGSIAYAQKDYQVGDAQFMAGLGMLERLKNSDELADKFAIYAQLLEQRGLPDEALKFYKKAYESSLEHE